MSTCKSCKYWTGLEFEEDHYVVFPDDDALVIKAEWGTCHRQDEVGSPMFTNDGSEYFSALRTRQTFSCCEFQAGSDEG